MDVQDRTQDLKQGDRLRGMIELARRSVPDLRRNAETIEPVGRGRGLALLRQAQHGPGEVAAARANAVAMRAIESENRRLKALLGIAEAQPRPIAAARLIGSTSASSRRFAVLSVGSQQGLIKGQPVRSGGGLIGRVVETGPDTARVLLVTDPDNVVPVRRATDGLPGFVQGGANGRIEIRLINAGVNPLHTGDVFVTSGSGGIYPPGIPVAVATQPHRDGATGQLASDPSDADYVLVLPIYQPAAVTTLEATQKAAPPPPEDETP